MDCGVDVLLSKLLSPTARTGEVRAGAAETAAAPATRETVDVVITAEDSSPAAVAEESSLLTLPRFLLVDILLFISIRVYEVDII